MLEQRPTENSTAYDLFLRARELRELPRLLKILDRASPPGLRVRFYGLDRTKKKPARLARRGAIERVPTFVLSAGGQEVGRIVESPRSTLEHDLALLAERLLRTP